MRYCILDHLIFDPLRRLFRIRFEDNPSLLRIFIVGGILGVIVGVITGLLAEQLGL